MRQRNVARRRWVIAVNHSRAVRVGKRNPRPESGMFRCEDPLRRNLSRRNPLPPTRKPPLRDRPLRNRLKQRRRSRIDTVTNSRRARDADQRTDGNGNDPKNGTKTKPLSVSTMRQHEVSFAPNGYRMRSEQKSSPSIRPSFTGRLPRCHVTTPTYYRGAKRRLTSPIPRPQERSR